MRVKKRLGHIFLRQMKTCQKKIRHFHFPDFFLMISNSILTCFNFTKKNYLPKGCSFFGKGGGIGFEFWPRQIASKLLYIGSALR